MRPGISSEPQKYRSNTSLPPRATSTECPLAALEASRSAIMHSAAWSMSLSSVTEASGQPSSRATGIPQPSGISACTGNAVSGDSAAPPRSEMNWRRLMQGSTFPDDALVLRTQRNASDRAILDQTDPPLRRTVGELHDVDIAA